MRLCTFEVGLWLRWFAVLYRLLLSAKLSGFYSCAGRGSASIRYRFERGPWGRWRTWAHGLLLRVITPRYGSRPRIEECVKRAAFYVTVSRAPARVRPL